MSRYCLGSPASGHRTVASQIFLVTLWIGVLLVTGCGYGKVSPAAYDYATALYSMTNRKSEGKLEDVSFQLQRDVAAGDLTTREATWLQDIIDDAQRGRWEAASQAARRTMEDQVWEAKP